jgi:hypothetical protein
MVFALPDGMVVGFGEMTVAREDVSAFIKEVSNIHNGWGGDAAAPHGSTVRAYAVLDDTKSMCQLPNEVTAP